MKKHVRLPQVEPSPRLGYLWLALGTLCSLFAANGRWDIPLAAWLGPLFLLRFTRTRKAFSGFALAWLASAVAMLFSLYSLQLLTPIIIMACLLFSTILTLPYLLDRLLTARLSLVSGLLASLLFPLSRVVGEYLISFTPAFGSVFSLAYTQYGNLPLLQIISVTGIYGVSFLIAWFASVGNWIWEQHFAWPRIRTVTLLYSGLLALVLLGGSLRLALFPPSAQTVRVAGISAAASTLQKVQEEIGHFATTQQFTPTDLAQMRAAFAPLDDELLNLSQREASAGAKIIVWPEIGAYTLAADKSSLLERAQTLAREAHIYLEMGLSVFQPPATYYDQAILVDQEGHVDWTYNKTYPAPGDPEKPGQGIVPVVETPYGRLANVICFDADFPPLMRQTGSQGVDIMLVPGNDWPGIDPWHTQHAVFRAIENGYALVRQASNSLAMTVDDEGNVLAATDYYTTNQQTMIASVPVKGVWTIYAHVGDLFAWLCLAGWLFLVGFAAFASGKRRTIASERSRLRRENEQRGEPVVK
jgi:apolipoprotein N-acyltransferase